jgi:hypothetical protein
MVAAAIRTSKPTAGAQNAGSLAFFFRLFDKRAASKQWPNHSVVHRAIGGMAVSRCRAASQISAARKARQSRTLAEVLEPGCGILPTEAWDNKDGQKSLHWFLTGGMVTTAAKRAQLGSLQPLGEPSDAKLGRFAVGGN